MENTNDDTQLIDAHKEHIIDDSEEEETFEYLNESTIIEKGLEEL